MENIEVKDFLEKFFNNLKIKIDKITVTEESDEKDIIFVKVETPDSGLLIGDRGATLDDIKYVLSKIASSMCKRNVIVQVEINDYFESKDRKMFSFIDSKVDFVIKNNTTVVLSNYTAYERKKIHTYIKEKNIEWLRSFSNWEDNKRVMHLSYINPGSRMSVSSIDIEWMDI